MNIRYTDTEIAFIVDLREVQQLTWDAIAERVGRGNTGTAIRAAYYKTKNAATPAPKQRSWRNCLRCSARFRSEGAHNRMCDECRGVETSPLEPESAHGFSSRRVSTTPSRIALSHGVSDMALLPTKVGPARER